MEPLLVRKNPGASCSSTTRHSAQLGLDTISNDRHAGPSIQNRRHAAIDKASQHERQRTRLLRHRQILSLIGRHLEGGVRRLDRPVGARQFLHIAPDGENADIGEDDFGAKKRAKRFFMSLSPLKRKIAERSRL